MDVDDGSDKENNNVADALVTTTTSNVSSLTISDNQSTPGEGVSESMCGEVKQKDKQAALRVREPLCPPWTRLTHYMHRGIIRFVVTLSAHAARYPKAYIVIITLFSITTLAVGFLTNFRLELNFETVATPINSQPQLFYKWITSDQGFAEDTRQVLLVLHNGGHNILHVQQARKLFIAIDAIRGTPGYDDLCQQGTYLDFDGVATCRVLSATGYWGHNVTQFDQLVNNDTDVRHAMSSNFFSNGCPVYKDAILGKYVAEPTTNQLISAQSYVAIVELPDKDQSDAFERAMLRRLQQLRVSWLEASENEPDDEILHLDLMTLYSYEVEFMRSILMDIYLIPFVAFMMIAFTCLIFYRHGDTVQSRSTLGAASVITITMSVMTGNGLMFIFGVPFTTLTQVLPFVVFGVGLDDTFIITGSYFQTDPKLHPSERIRLVLEDVGLSISLTTITTLFAFLLGLMSSLPGVKWLCIYSFVTIGIDFIYQITYFIALLVLDERRVQANRRDCCIWITVDSNDEEVEVIHPPKGITIEKTKKKSRMRKTANPPTCVGENEPRQSHPSKFMCWYANFLLKPHVKLAVLSIFAIYFGVCLWSSTQLTQQFNVSDYVPDDSYLKTVLTSMDKYAGVIKPIAVYFREVDQTNPDIQSQMITYVNQLEGLEQLGGIQIDFGGNTTNEARPFCWVRDFHALKERYSKDPMYSVLANMTFLEQLNFALKDPIVRELYGQDIIRDDTGNITASRCWLFLSNLDVTSVEDQIDMLHDQREIGAVQPINQIVGHNGKGEWAFFAFDTLFLYWAAYVQSIKELISTIISGVVASTAIAFLMIPHWTAPFFVGPLVIVLYITYLGTLQFLGLHINGLFYICVVVSIGLLVDYLMHVLFRYYETSPLKSRDERVREALETMGASILIGGITTFLGVVPLCLSVTKVFMTVFLAFFVMVVLGLAHGLILMPVLLTYVGPLTGLPHFGPTEVTDKQTESPESIEPTEEAPESTEEMNPAMEPSQSDSVDDITENEDVKSEPDGCSVTSYAFSDVTC